MFEDHPEFPLERKIQILNEWRLFVRSGFEFERFSERVYQFLSNSGSPNFFGRNLDHKGFWQVYFDDQIGMLWMVVEQFSLRDVLGDGHDLDWWDRYDSPIFGDLSRAMVEVMEQVGADFMDIIEAYEDHCLQSEIDQKIADLAAKEPKLPASGSRRILVRCL